MELDGEIGLTAQSKVGIDIHSKTLIVEMFCLHVLLELSKLWQILGITNEYLPTYTLDYI